MVKDDGGDVTGCFISEEAANKQLAALNANENQEGSRMKARFSPGFRAQATSFRQEEDDQGRNVGVARLRVAAFGIPDTEVAVGNEKRQVIDQGSFRTWIENTDFEEQPVQFYRDHGNAHLTGFVDSALQIGWADNFAETNALETDGHYLLDTAEGATAFAKVRAKPQMVQFSFRWPPTEKVKDGDDGFEHVTEFESVDEVSQVGFGAQEKTGVVRGSLRAAYNELAKKLREEGEDVPVLGEDIEARASKEELHRHLEKAHGMSGDGTVEELEAKHSKAHDDGKFAEGMGHGGRGNLMTSRLTEILADQDVVTYLTMLLGDEEGQKRAHEIVGQVSQAGPQRHKEQAAALAAWYGATMFPTTRQNTG